MIFLILSASLPLLQAAVFTNGTQLTGSAYYTFSSVDALRQGDAPSKMGIGNSGALEFLHDGGAFTRIAGAGTLRQNTDPNTVGTNLGTCFAGAQVSALFSTGTRYFLHLSAAATSKNGLVSYQAGDLVAFSSLTELISGNTGDVLRSGWTGIAAMGASSESEVFVLTSAGRFLTVAVADIADDARFTDHGLFFMDPEGVLGICSDGQNYYAHFSASAGSLENLGEFEVKYRHADFSGYFPTGQGTKTPIPEGYEWGSFHYTNVFSPLEPDYMRAYYQSGMFGQWLSPSLTHGSGAYDAAVEAAGGDTTAYSRGYLRMEGGVGTRKGTRFHNNAHKLIMGGVPGDFSMMSTGPGLGAGDWHEDRGRYGAAVLSNRLVFPLDSLNLAEGTTNKMFGYGYYPLPLTDPQPMTGGQAVPKGNHCWTLFLDAENFKGPVAFFVPYHWAKATVDQPHLHGEYFDNNLLMTPRTISMETQHSPGVVWDDVSTGEKYYRCLPYRFPIDEDGVGRMMTHLMSPDDSMWEAVSSWLVDGGEVAPTSFLSHPDAIYTSPIMNLGPINITWKFREIVNGEYVRTSLATDSYTERIQDADPSTSAIRWNPEWVTPLEGEELAQLPEFYKFTPGDTHVRPIKQADVPAESSLHDFDSIEDFSSLFNTSERDTSAYTTPLHPDYVTSSAMEMVWTRPGPVRGPYHAELGDGSTITYYWYKFNEQPAILNADMSDSERRLVQSRIEAIHTNWSHTDTYFPTPDFPLASLAANLIVTPPEGLEIGYVPICVGQQLTTESLPDYPEIERTIVPTHKNRIHTASANASEFKVELKELIQGYEYQIITSDDLSNDSWSPFSERFTAESEDLELITPLDSSKKKFFSIRSWPSY